MGKHTEDYIGELLSKMTLEQKVGGCLVMDFMGTVITPYLLRIINEFHVAGLRVNTYLRTKVPYSSEVDSTVRKKALMKGFRDPKGHCKDYVLKMGSPRVSPFEYAQNLNKLREVAMNRPLGIPIHTTLDQEGNGSENYTLGNPVLLPAPMGLASTGDTNLVYRAGDVLAKQLTSAGINWIHSPQLDVNTNHRNPEVATRAYSDNCDIVIRYARETSKAFRDNNLIATGKHFPGRGDSATDSHNCLPEVLLSEKRLRDVHIRPYIDLIAEGLPAVMIAHTVYPSLDNDVPATLSKRIITDLLKKELGFKGVVTSDNMLMGGIVSRYNIVDACISAINAGQDLILLRSESPLCEEVFYSLLEAAKNKVISEKRLNDANARVLRLKYEYGLFDNGGVVDANESNSALFENSYKAVERKVAEKAIQIRDEICGLPIDINAKVLVVEQVHSTHISINNIQCHPAILWEKMFTLAPNVYHTEICEASDEDLRRVMNRIPEVDIIVVTNYVERRSDKDISPFIRKIAEKGKPVIVITNSPFAFGSPSDFPIVINIFSANPESLRVAAEYIFGLHQS